MLNLIVLFIYLFLYECDFVRRDYFILYDFLNGDQN